MLPLSFEFFPPKTAEQRDSLQHSAERLKAHAPEYVSCTFGAGGSTLSYTYDTVVALKAQGLEVAPHLSCMGGTREEIRELLQRYVDIGCRRIVALRGDMPSGMAVAGEFRHAIDLVRFIRSEFDGHFHIEVAGYPEFHPQARNADDDLRHLVEKVNAGVDFLVSQLFFENAAFLSFCDRAQKAGVAVPIVAGIMPVTNVKQIERFTAMCGASFPQPFAEHLRTIEDDPQEVFWAGVQYASHQCRQLLEPQREDFFGPAPLGVPGIHFYTLNKSPASRAIFEILQLTRAAF